MEAIGVRWDECVGVGSGANVLATILIVSILLHQQLLLLLVSVILLQVLWREWLAQRQLFRIADAQVFAQ